MSSKFLRRAGSAIVIGALALAPTTPASATGSAASTLVAAQRSPTRWVSYRDARLRIPTTWLVLKGDALNCLRPTGPNIDLGVAPGPVCAGGEYSGHYPSVSVVPYNDALLLPSNAVPAVMNGISVMESPKLTRASLNTPNGVHIWVSSLGVYIEAIEAKSFTVVDSLRHT